MRPFGPLSALALGGLALTGGASAADQAGTKGRDFDRVVFENVSDDDVALTARVMTINRHSDSASEITVVDNGERLYGPDGDSSERWKRPIAVKGKGRHEVVLTCRSLNASPVYCGLTLDDARVRAID